MENHKKHRKPQKKQGKSPKIPWKIKINLLSAHDNQQQQLKRRRMMDDDGRGRYLIRTLSLTQTCQWKSRRRNIFTPERFNHSNSCFQSKGIWLIFIHWLHWLLFFGTIHSIFTCKILIVIFTGFKYLYLSVFYPSSVLSEGALVMVREVSW